MGVAVLFYLPLLVPRDPRVPGFFLIVKAPWLKPLGKLLGQLFPCRCLLSLSVWEIPGAIVLH